jgi:pimeloyl-ACP methyl ester carboxylesterase
MPTAIEPRRQTFESDGLTLHYVEYEPPSPEALPVVMLHGLSSAWAAWRRVAQHLASNYRVIALDQRGHGDSDWAPSDRYRTEDYLGDLQALVDRIELDRFVLIGQSMGGHNTIAYAARHPERLLCAIANDIPLYLRRPATPADYEEQFPGGQHRIYASIEDWMVERRRASPLTPEWGHQLAAEAQLRAVEGGYQLRHDPQASIRWQPDDLRDEARSIRLPLLIIRGGRSTVLDAQTLQDMDMAIPGARSVTLERAGHATYHDMYDEWTTVAGDFLAAHAAR